MWRRFASNALANLVSGASGTLYQVVLTAIATHAFGKSGFTVWALALSVAAFVPLFSANLSTVVTRRLVERGPEHASAVLAAGRELARRLALLALLVASALAIALHQRSGPLQSVAAPMFALLVFLLSLAQVWQVLLQPRFGWHFGAEKNWNVARTIVLARVGGLLALAAACWLLPGLPMFAAAGLAMGCAVGLVPALLADGQAIRAPIASTSQATGEERQALLPLVRAFAVWALGSAAIQNGVPPFVSLIAPQSFNAFFIAYTLNLIVVGVIASGSSALLAPLTRHRLARRFALLERWLTVGPFVVAAALLVLMAVLNLFLPLFLKHWSAGIVTADEVRLPFFWLAAQTIARSTTLLHSVLLSSSANPSQLRRPIVMEIGLSVLVAAPLGYMYGERALLAALTCAGLLTGLYTTWITLSLDVCRAEMRARLLLIFVAAQALGLAGWFTLGRA